MDRILISATDRNLEHYALNMFRSFRLFDRYTPMACIVRDISKTVETSLIGLGVRLFPYSWPKSPADMKNISLSIANYLPKKGDNPKIMWMDIDALFVQEFNELWNYDASIIALPGINEDGWITMQPNGHQYIALGMFVTNADFLRKLWPKWINYEDRTKAPDEGSFIRACAGSFDFTQLKGPLYYCGRGLIEELYLTEIDNLGFKFHGAPVYPKCLQFNIKLNGKRPESEAVNQWIKNRISA